MVRVKRVVARFELVDAGWSSPVARQAHNLKVVGSNPTPATTDIIRPPATSWGPLLFLALGLAGNRLTVLGSNQHPEQFVILVD